MAKQIYSIKALKEKKFHTHNFNDEYRRLFGNPEQRFVAMCYGESGSGKSVFMLKFADYFARNFGKALYNSHEEGANQTIVDRINNFNIGASKLFVANALPFEAMCQKIEKNYYRLVILDSVKYMGFNFAQLKELRERFANRKLSIMMVDFGKSQGNPHSGVDLLHASDVKMYFKNGTVHSISRYLATPAECRLFSPQKRQLVLF
jgi:predicted ATP-dependent serine protease